MIKTLSKWSMMKNIKLWIRNQMNASKRQLKKKLNYKSSTIVDSCIYKNNWLYVCIRTIDCVCVCVAPTLKVRVCVLPTFQVNPFTPLSFLYIKPLSNNEVIKNCPMHHQYYNIRAQSPLTRLSNKARMQAIKKEVGRVLE